MTRVSDVRMMDLDDAQSIVLHAAEQDVADVDVQGLREAAETLSAALARSKAELARWQARAAAEASRAGRPLVRGSELRDVRQDEGGFRHHLNGESVQSGQALQLLTNRGWLAGRYETRVGATGDSVPYFHVVLPGVWESVAFPIPPGARLAWPREFEQR